MNNENLPVAVSQSLELLNNNAHEKWSKFGAIDNVFENTARPNVNVSHISIQLLKYIAHFFAGYLSP